MTLVLQPQNEFLSKHSECEDSWWFGREIHVMTLNSWQYNPIERPGDKEFWTDRACMHGQIKLFTLFERAPSVCIRVHVFLVTLAKRIRSSLPTNSICSFLLLLVNCKLLKTASTLCGLNTIVKTLNETNWSPLPLCLNCSWQNGYEQDSVVCHSSGAKQVVQCHHGQRPNTTVFSNIAIESNWKCFSHWIWLDGFRWVCSSMLWVLISFVCIAGIAQSCATTGKFNSITLHDVSQKQLDKALNRIEQSLTKMKEQKRSKIHFFS